MLNCYDDEDNGPMNESMLPSDKNCHERCQYSKICWDRYKCKGSHSADYPWMCPIFDKINDLVNETSLPFTDPDEIDTGGDEDDNS